MRTPDRPPSPKSTAARSERDLELDLQVALTVEDYRWVEWNRQALAEAPLYEPGRFVAHPGELLSHLYVAASGETPLAAEPYRRLPSYSSEAAPAIRAAERAGLFAEGGANVSCSPAGVWRLSVPEAAIEMEDECLPRLLSRAALRMTYEAAHHP